MLLVFGCMASPTATAVDTDPLILFNHESNGALVYSYFDTADPGMAYPIDIANLPDAKALNTLGIFNGVLYVRESDGKLYGIDLGSGEKLGLNTSLSDRYVQEGPIIYVLPGKANAEVVQVIDLRGPFARTAKLPSASVTPYKAFYATDDKLRYFYYDGPSELHESATANDMDILHCTIEDFRLPESPPLRFSVTVKATGQTWRIEPPHWFTPGRVDSQVIVVRHPPQFEVLPFTWIGQNSFGCVALAVDVEGVTWEGKGDGGPSLFVVNLQTRTGRVLPLSTLPLREPLELKKGGPDPNYYAIDSRSMALLDQKGPNEPEAVEVLSEHFKLSHKQGPMQVLHGAQPLELKRGQNASHAEVDASGERVLVQFPRASVCYDIYGGYYAECEPKFDFHFQDRSDLRRVEVSPSEGWAPLVQQPIKGWSGGEAPSSRRDRSREYTLLASSGKTAYAEGETVSIQISLTLVGPEPQWTEAPTPDFPNLTGTLASSVYAVVVSQIENLKPVQPAAPVYLDPGGVLTASLDFIPEAPGAYTLALAYGGNSESEWYGCAKAPLLRFTVGEATQDSKARLRYAIQDYIDRRGSREDKVFEELRAAGNEGADLLAGMLLEIPMPDFLTRMPSSDDEQKRWSTLSSLCNYLADLRSPRLIPYFKELLASDNREKKSRGLSGIRSMHEYSKDPAFRSELEAIVRDAYADDEPIWKARAEKDLDVVLFPNLYEELRGQALGSDADLQRKALEGLAEKFLWQRDTFSGDMEQFTVIILTNQQFHLSQRASNCVERFYRRGVDRPNVQRAIDEYRLHYPRWFDGGFLDTESDLWDMAWLRRAADEPTEARFTLLQRSIERLESHTSVKRTAAFPGAWSDLQNNDAARAAFSETLKAWADFIQTSPAPFRIPDLKN